MKIFNANFYFKLPDDFNGSDSDALRYIADYIEKHPNIAENDNIKQSKIRDQMWLDFCDVTMNNYKMHGHACNVCEVEDLT